MPVAESAVAPPGPIPNPVVTRRSAGEYCRSDSVGGEAAAGTPRPRHSGLTDCPNPPHIRPSLPSASSVRRVPRGGAAAARWAHNPKVAGSNPAPATNN